MKPRRLEPTWLVFLLAMLLSAVAAASADADEFVPPVPESEYLPAAPGEPPIDFCASWNPEFGFRGYKCCTQPGPVRYSRRGRRVRRASACAPDRIKWTFCDEMTPEQREYIAGVKAGTIDPLESIWKGMGSRGAQAFCGVSNGFLVEGRALVPTSSNRIELRNEARCANFGTDPLVGALEWTGREIKKEYYEPEFKQARLIIGDISPPRGGCVSGRGGRRAHKSHTAGVDVDLAYFNPRSGGSEEERFTRTFYVATNWWFLKKLFKNPLACVKVVFVDKSNIAKLARYAKDDPEWPKFRNFIRHVRGHRDHFHIRFGGGPGPAGCASDPALEETEDLSDDSATDEGTVAKADVSEVPDEMGVDLSESDEGTEAIDDASEETFDRVATKAPGAATTAEPSAVAAGTVSSVQTGLASGTVLGATTLPPHKLEPSITNRLFAHSPRRSKHRRARRRH